MTLSEFGVECEGRALELVATDVCSRRPVFLSASTHPSMPLSLAVRASCCIPLVFKAVHYEEMVLVDGGATLNFPLERACLLCSATGIAVGIECSAPASYSAPRTLPAFLAALVEASIGAQKHHAPIPPNARMFNVRVDKKVASMDLDANAAVRMRLFCAGRRALRYQLNNKMAEKADM